MKRCFVYHRVSSEQQIDGSGIKRQAELLEQYITSRGILDQMDDQNPVILADPGLSAWKGHNITHGELGQWMEQVASGMWDNSVLIVENLDRFSRQNPFQVLGYINSLVEHGISIHDVNMNMIINHQNSVMLPMVIMNAQRAYDESKYKSMRIGAGWRKKRLAAIDAGTIITRKTPNWIDVVEDRYVLNDKARIVQEVFKLYLEGLGSPTIARHMTALGDDWRMAPGREWRAEVVHKLLTNKRVTGTIFLTEIVRDYNDYKNESTTNETEVDVYPAVISKEEFEIVQAMLKSKNKGRIRTKKESTEFRKNFMFGNICKCARCNGNMYNNTVVSKRNPVKSEPKIEEYRYVRCLNERDNLCDNKAVRYEMLELYLIEHVKMLNLAEIITPVAVDPQMELVRVRIDEEKQHISEYEEGIKKRKEAGRKVSFEMMDELEEAQERLKKLEESVHHIEDTVVDYELLEDFNPSELYDVTNIELRSRIERELLKVLDTVTLYREGNNVTVTIKYKNNLVLKHVLILNISKRHHMVSNISIQEASGAVTFTTPSFALVVNDGLPRVVQSVTEPMNIIDWSLLLNYIDAEYDATAIWMRHNFNFLFS